MPERNLAFIRSENFEKNFEDHLQDEFNERILFSGSFGSGKSTFLRHFFEISDHYIVLKLFPVNYSVAPNQDVFELIKYELLYELLSRYPEDIELQQDQFSTLLVGQMFLLHQMKIDLPLKLLSKAASLIPGGALAAEKSITDIIDVSNSFKDYKKQINETVYNRIDKYIKKAQVQKGHVYETDEITQLIVSLLAEVKTKRSKTNSQIQTVLLIDDLDRLDPEHVFRLFNIFSAHYDDNIESNKFGFDKIIFVCDVKNIREMFNHKYGLNVEFSGYIDKFYSTEIFHFDFRRLLRDSIQQIVNEAIYNPYKYFKKGEINPILTKRYILQDRNPFYMLFACILIDMVDQNIIRIRNLKKFNSFSLPNVIINTNFGEKYGVLYPFIVFLINFEKLFTSQTDIENALKKLYLNYNSDYEIASNKNADQSDDVAKNIIHYSLFGLLSEKQIFGYDINFNKQYLLPILNENNDQIFIIYTIDYERENNFVIPRFIKCVNDAVLVNDIYEGSVLVRPNPYWFLYNSYNKIKNRNYF